MVIFYANFGNKDFPNLLIISPHLCLPQLSVDLLCLTPVQAGQAKCHKMTEIPPKADSTGLCAPVRARGN